MQIDVLGPLRVSGAAGAVTVPAGRSSAALCWFALKANEAVTPESLARALWADPTHSSVAKARMIARTLSTVLDPGVLETGRELRLIVSDDAIDARRFERLIAEGRRHVAAGRAEQGAVNLRAALLLWRGDPYPELDRTAPARRQIDRLVELRLDAQEDLNALVLEDGLGFSVVADLRAQVILHPVRPRLRRQLALALYRTGRQVDALDVLHDLRTALGDPDGRTGELQSAILSHDPALHVDGPFTR